MKRSPLFSILWLALALAAFAPSRAIAATTNRITAKITVTTATSNGFAITVNGSTRTVTQSVSSAASQIITNHTVAGSASNLYNHIVASRFEQVLITGYTNGSNVIFLRGAVGLPMSVTILSNWATVSYSTQAVTSGMTDVRVPMDGEPDPSVWTNNASELVRGMDYGATNEFRTNSPPLRQFVNLGPEVQRLINDVLTNSAVQGGSMSNTVLTNIPVGNINVFVVTNLVALGGSASNVTLTNVVWLNGYLGGLTNGQLVNVFITNAPAGFFTNLIARGGYQTNMMFDRPFLTNATIISGTVTGSLFTVTGSGLGTWLTIDSTSTTAALGPAIHFYRSRSGAAVNSNDVLGHLIFGGFGDTAQQAAARIKGYALETFTDSISGGRLEFETTTPGANTTTVRATINQFGVGISNHLQVAGTITNSTFTGTNVWSGDISHPPLSITSIANGFNPAIPIGTNTYIRLSGTVTASPTITGVAGGRNGKAVRFLNALGYSVTITENTADPVEANRFDLYDNVDVTIPNGGWWDQWWDASISRWRISDVYPQTTVATNVTGDYITLSGSTQTHTRGRLYYDTNCECLKFFNNETNVSLDFGQEQWARVVNHSGVTITNGAAVYFTGATNSIATVAMANGLNLANARAFGLATMDITNGGIGFVTKLGAVNNLNTTNWTNGAKLFLGGVSGQLTNSPPTVGAQYFVGVVTSSNATAGIVEVSPTPPIPFIHSATLDFPNTASQTSSDLPITVSGATQDSVVTMLGVPPAAATGGGSFFAFPSNNTVFIRFVNQTSGNLNPASATFRVGINQF
jgi:hypothetical protein